MMLKATLGTTSIVDSDTGTPMGDGGITPSEILTGANITAVNWALVGCGSQGTPRGRERWPTQPDV